MPDIKVRVGQQNAIKVVSSISGSTVASTAENVIGGIASVSQLNVSGISTFVGVATFKSNVYIDGDLYIGDDINFDEFTGKKWKHYRKFLQ
jgi:cytoskeletal protein CcmA (bactofilin family)